MTTAERHYEISDRFLEQAYVEFEGGDLLQASEKAWGALAHYVNAVAKTRDWPHSTHRDLNLNASRLIQGTDDASVHRQQLMVVNALHANFYQDFLDEDSVLDGLNATGSLLTALKAVGADRP